MSVHGRTIRLFLVDGTPTGLITAEIMNWSGHVLVGPRSRLADVLDRAEVGRTGVYLLVGDDPSVPSKDKVYLGESDNVGKRIAQHAKDPEKDFWDRLCLVTSKDQNLTKAHVRYLESRMIQLAKAADRSNVGNSTAPEYGYLPESDLADMEFFLAQIQVVLPVLGFDVLRAKPGAKIQGGQPYPAIPTEGGSEALELILTDKKFGVEAHALEEDGEVLVFAGSTARADADYAQNQYKPLRDQLIKDGRLQATEDPKLLRFSEGVTFKSPSAASAVIFGRNDNGRRSWRVKSTGQTLADWQDAQVPTSIELPSDE